MSGNFRILIARRSIYNPKLNVVGYVLNLRDVNSPQTESAGLPDTITIDDFKHLLSDRELDHILGKGFIFVHVNEAILKAMNEHKVVLRKDQLVVVIDEKHINLTGELVMQVEELVKRGYAVALNGYLDNVDTHSLLQKAKYFFVNIKNKNEEQIRGELTRILGVYPLKVIAENVESHESFDLMKNLGCEFFEGYFLSLPNLENSSKVTTNRIAAMRLLTSLDNPDISVKEVEDLLSQDSRLTYKMFRLINSAAYGLPRVVNSLREAVVLLGLQQIKTWASLTVMSSVEEKPKDLLLTTMIRAKMSELIADLIGADDTKSFFTVGLFSTLDALLDKPMSEVLSDLSLSEQLKAAILNHEGEMGEVIELIISYERGEWDKVKESGLDPKKVSEIYLQSVNWASNSFKELRP